MSCTECSLHETRTNIVFGEGPVPCDVMLVGEAPGANEDKQGRPFVGASGKMLELFLEEAGISREEVYITNVVKCLKGDSRIRTNKGTMRINFIVKNKPDIKVWSVNKDGIPTLGNIVGYHRSKLAGRDVFKLILKHSRKNSQGNVGASLTEDHEVLTKRGWIQVKELKKDDKVHTGTLRPNYMIREALIGMMFGDSHVSIKGNHITTAHSEKQIDYINFKARLFGKQVQEYEIEGKEKVYGANRFRINASPYIRELVEIWKTDKLKLLERFSPISLAFLMMDDGWTRNKSTSRPATVLCTCGFSKEENEALASRIKELGIPCKVTNYTYPRIDFNVEQTELLSALVAPYICPSMNYKLCPQDRSVTKARWKLDQEPFYDSFRLVRVNPLECEPTVYCLTVEPYNNFITISGVVHNCRPPGNRIPWHEERMACKRFLDAEISNVNPKKILILGKTALMSFKDGNYPKHAEPYEFHGRTIWPMYHPAYSLYSHYRLPQMLEEYKRALMS